jgi:formylglycine-generating enzyme required for sulfatase activity
MLNINNHFKRYQIRNVAWLAMAATSASCRFDMPRPSGADAPTIDASGIDTPVDAPTPLPRCIGLDPTCGASANESCCAVAATVESGTFYRSYDGVGFTDMTNSAMVSAFVLDRYEVTVGRFRAFVNARQGTQARPPVGGSGAHPSLAGSGWDCAWNASLVADQAALTSSVKCDSTYQTWTDAPGENESKPMNCVTWYEAMAFCIWDGGYLPTEAEWNYAASGGEQRVYPWSKPASSTMIDCDYANYGNSLCTGSVDRVGSRSPVGDGRWGHTDLAGNVWEWTLDWHASYSNPCTDCANLMASSTRVIRGGSFYDDAPDLRAAGRSMIGPSVRNFGLGVRCARSAP